MRGIRLLSLSFALTVIFLGGPLWGDIYAYRDENGVVSFSNVPVDPRYRFKMRETAPRAQEKLYETDRKRYDSLIEEAARENGLDPHLVRAVVEVESNYDPGAVSPKGATGLMQLMPETARRFGLSDLYHPEKNLKTGSRYLRELMDRYQGDMQLALAAYNAGEGAVDRYQQVPPYEETQGYVRKVIEVYRKKTGQK